MTYIYGLVVFLLAAGILWHHRDPSIKRASIFILFSVFALTAALHALGTPKPIWAEMGRPKLIVAVQHDPGNRIYIWTNSNPPIAYFLPWDEETAKKLEIGMRKARETGQPGLLYGLEYGEFQFHPPPVREPPHKE